MESVAVTHLNYLQQISYSVDYMNENAINLLFHIFLDPKTIALMYQDNNDFDELQRESIRLKQLVEVNPFVHSIYVYNKKRERYLGSWGEMLTLDKPFFDTAITEMLNRQAPTLLPVAREIVNPYNRSVKEQVFTYIFYEFRSSDGGVDGAVILNVKSEYLSNMTDRLKQRSSQNQSEAIVLNTEGELIASSSGNEHKGDEKARRSILDAIGEADMGHLKLDLDGEDYLIIFSRSQPTNWYYVMLQPYSQVLSNLHQIKTITIQVAALVLIMGIAVAVFMSFRIHSPFKQLRNKIINVQGYQAVEHTSQDEIALLDGMISESYRNRRMTKKKEMLRHFVRTGVLSRHVENDDLLIQIDSTQPILIVLCRIDDFHQFSQRFSAKERELMRFALANVVQGHLAKHFSCESVEVSEEQIISIVQVSQDTWESDEREMTGLLAEAQAWCQTHLNFSFTCVVSDVVTDTGEVPALINHLQQLSQYRFVYGRGSLLTEKIAENHRSVDKILANEETELMDALTNGQLEEAKRILDEILKRQKQLKYESAIANVLQLAYSVYNRLSDLEDYGGGDGSHVDWSISLKELLNIETLDEIQVRLEEVFSRITWLVWERKERRSSALADSVISYIYQNYKDPSLCLESIADYLKYSKVYLSKIFRDIHGVSVSEFITDYRIARIMERIGDASNMDALLEEQGITNKKYFYTIFKRKMGVSLREYRNKLVVQPLLEDNNSTK
ncbi:AraC family transcriptional regulator [Paenibacillus agaridevorans]|uniref:AraC family transcriptional regulator n=1 Tax=Paenibacillus agaridevorans TaxID=171404 RepID=A0A2R5EQW3_9BACL|nr:AraC family transcriptional regulator [Paenibacillus agaridevorans]